MRSEHKKQLLYSQRTYIKKYKDRVYINEDLVKSDAEILKTFNFSMEVAFMYSMCGHVVGEYDI